QQHLHSFPTRRSSDLKMKWVLIIKFILNHGEKQYNQYKYDGTYSSFLYFHSDSLDIPKKTTITNVLDDNYNSIKGNFVSNFILKDRKSTRLNSSHVKI